jgi:hypothetical protein
MLYFTTIDVAALRRAATFILNKSWGVKTFTKSLQDIHEIHENGICRFLKK